MKDTKELRDAVDTVQPERVKLALRLGQSRVLYQGFQVCDYAATVSLCSPTCSLICTPARWGAGTKIPLLRRITQRAIPASASQVCNLPS